MAQEPDHPGCKRTVLRLCGPDDLPGSDHDLGTTDHDRFPRISLVSDTVVLAADWEKDSGGGAV